MPLPKCSPAWRRLCAALFVAAALGLIAVEASAQVQTPPAPATPSAPVANPPAASSPAAPAAPLNPTAEDRAITRAVVQLLRRGHLSGHPLDDEIASRTLKTFLKSLDAMKAYFYQADIDTFEAQKNDIDDKARDGDTTFAYDIFNVLTQRVDERLKVIDELLAQEPDFTIEEEIIRDPDVLTWPVNAAEARERWRKRVKYDLLVEKSEGKVGEEARAKLRRRYHGFAKRLRQTDADELLEMYLTSLTTSYDPHTSYMSKETMDNFRIIMGLRLEGIGAALQSSDGETTVSKVIPGGAADKDGRLKTEDRIVGVGQGESGEIVDVVERKLSDVVSLVRGEAGTVVRLQVIPAGQTVPVVYTITRAQIELKDSEARAEVVELGDANGRPLRLGVIDLPSFYMDMDAAQQRRSDYKSTTRDVQKILEGFKQQRVDAVVMDLRRNGGGSLTEAISLTGLFIDQGPVVQVKGADGEVLQHDDTEKGMAWDGPLVVLTSKGSASASEIFAGAIQDYGRGLIVGDHTTHGKGTVQTLRDLGRELFFGPNAPTLGALKITMQKFYRPNGESTQKRGVLADIELPSLTEHLPIGEGDLDYAMEFDRVPAAPFRKVNLVDQAMINSLRDLSKQRLAQSTDFQKEAQNISRYEERKNRKTLTLKEDKFLAERAELDAEKQEEDKLDEENGGATRPVVDPKDYHLKESLAITADYLRLVRVVRAN